MSAMWLWIDIRLCDECMYECMRFCMYANSHRSKVSPPSGMTGVSFSFLNEGRESMEIQYVVKCRGMSRLRLMEVL